MNVEELDRLYATFRRSVWRLETRQHYTVPDDGPRLEAWRAGQPLPVRPGKARWLAEVREMVADGKRVGRVHVVDTPLSEYVRYELDVYAENVAAGEDVLVVERDLADGLANLTSDFVIFDGETARPSVVWFDYDRDGHLLRYRLATDPITTRGCQRRLDLASTLAVPLNQFVAAIG